MPMPQELYSVLTARAATHHESARLLELLAKADEVLARSQKLESVKDSQDLIAPSRTL